MRQHHRVVIEKCRAAKHQTQNKWLTSKYSYMHGVTNGSASFCQTERAKFHLSTKVPHDKCLVKVNKK